MIDDIWAATLAVTLLVSAAGCADAGPRSEAWRFTEPDVTGEPSPLDAGLPTDLADASCREGRRRPLDSSCGYEERGEAWAVCREGQWVGECRGVWFNNCRELSEARPDAASGTYTVDPGGPADDTLPPFEVDCDMETDGGGWTGLRPCLVRETLGGEMTAIQSSSVSGIDEQCRPFTTEERDEAGQVYHYTFEIPGEFREFYLQDYAARARSDGSNSELGLVQHDWDFGRNYCDGTPPPPREDNYGDISFGASDLPGPTTSFSRVVSTGPNHPECPNCVIEWTENGTIYDIGKRSESFRIGWGECGRQMEGWYPWWSGTIWVR